MSIAFIVDGHQEKLIVQRLCEGAPVRMTLLNGKDVKLAAISKTVMSLIKLLRGRHFPIVVIVDREDRSISALDIESQIRADLEAGGCRGDHIIVSCPDRMIENWILAGNPYCNSAARIVSEIIEEMEGSPGKRIIKQELRKYDIAYDETGNGVELFCTMDLRHAAENSPSFRRLFDGLKGYCPKLRFISGQTS